MVKQSSLKFRLRKIDETRNYFLKYIKHNNLMSEILKRHKYLNFVKNLLILSSTVTGCVPISTFFSLVCIPVGIMSSVVGIKDCAITAVIKKYNSIIETKKKKHDKIVLLGNDKLNAILISKALIDSYISHDEFVLVNNVLREYKEMEKEIKNSKTSVEYKI